MSDKTAQTNQARDNTNEMLLNSRISLQQNSETSGTIEPSVPNHFHVTKKMKHLLYEFRELYEDRLRRLEFETIGHTEEEVLKMKVRVLQAYVQDLGDQSQVLVQSIEELEIEAHHKVARQELKLRSTDKIINDLDHRRRALEDSVRALRSENTDLKSDLNSLTRLTQKAGYSSSLEVSGLRLKTVALEEVLAQETHSMPVPTLRDGTPSEVEDLESRLRSGESVVRGLEREIQSTRTTENASQLFKANERALRLQEELTKKEDALREREDAWRRREKELVQKNEEEATAEKRRRDQEHRRREEIAGRTEDDLRRRAAEEKARHVEWRKRCEEQGKAHALAVTEWEEKAAILKEELEKCRALAERQQGEMMELRQRKDSLQSEIQTLGSRLCETQRVMTLRGEETQRLQTQLDQIQSARTLDTKQAANKMASLKSEPRAGHERSLVDKEEKTRQITRERNRPRENGTSTRGQMADLRQTAADMADQLQELQQRYQRSLEENARLCTRADTHTVSSHSRLEALTSELRNAENQLRPLKTQLQDKEKQLEGAARKILWLENSLREAEQHCVLAKTEVREHSQLLEQSARELERVTLNERAAVLEARERGERLSHLQQEACSLRASQESLRGALSAKEQHARQLSQDNSQLRDRLATLHAELQDQLQQSAQVGERVRRELSHARRVAAKKMERREAKVCVLTKELAESQQQCEDARRELHGRQTALEKLQQEVNHVRAKMEEQVKERLGLSQGRDKLEADLALTSEKHRTAQLEVSTRDQAVLHLTAQLRTAQQKHQGALEELATMEEEVRRLNQKVKGHRDEAAQLRERVREGEQLRDQGEMQQQQLHSQLLIGQEQIRSQAESIKQLNSDLETIKQTHKADKERWTQKNFLLHSQLKQANEELAQSQAKTREQGSEVTQLKVMLGQAGGRLQQAIEKVELLKGVVKTQHGEMAHLLQQLSTAQEGMKVSANRAHDQDQTVAIFKRKYSVAMEKVQQLQEQVTGLEEELQYSQKQLSDAKEANGAVRAELAELEGRYQEKLVQWRSSEEVSDQLTDELQSNQNALREAQEKLAQSEDLASVLKEQVDTLKQQRGTEQVERLAECERTLVQARAEAVCREAELKKRCQEKAGLERTVLSLQQDLVASRQTHLDSQSHANVEVTRLEEALARRQQEVARLQQALGRAHSTGREWEQEAQRRGALLQQSGEDLKEGATALELRGRELAAAREEVRRLREEARGEESARRSAKQENQSLTAQIRQQGQQVEGLRRKHLQTVEELTACGEEVRRTAECLNEGRLAEEKRRLLSERLEREAAELRQALQQALEERLDAQREKQDMQEQLMEGRLALEDLQETGRILRDSFLGAETQGKATSLGLLEREEGLETLRLELNGTRLDNKHLRQESQLVMSNVDHWIKEQRAAGESLSVQMKAQNQVLASLTQEKNRLQEANDGLKEELRTQGEVGDERERALESLKGQMKSRDNQQQEDREGESCVAHNLNRIQDMQTRLRGNLEAIATLNQQFSAVGAENQRLRLQLEEERDLRRRLELRTPQFAPPRGASNYHPHLSFPTRHAFSHSPLPPVLPLQFPPSPGPVLAPEDSQRRLTRAELSGGGPPWPGQLLAAGEACSMKLGGELSS